MFSWFRSKRKPRPQDDPEIERILRKMENFLTSDAMQNAILPEQVKALVIGGINCDKILSGDGDFGRAPTNPIPVNGPIGQVMYLSRLRTSDKNCPLMFHRVGSVPNGNRAIDMYEVLSTDDRVREYLFLSLYHPRKSMLAPSGHKLAKSHDNSNPMIGVNFTSENFPKELDLRIRDMQRDISLPLPVSEVRMYLYGNKLGPVQRDI